MQLLGGQVAIGHRLDKDTGLFSLETLQAVSDWQRGFNPKQKVRRAEALKAAAQRIDPAFKSVDGICFRQVVLKPKYIMDMGLRYQLDESVSSWTHSFDVAKDFKGGVVPKGEQALTVIFGLFPPAESVVLNLAALYADASFRQAIQEHKSSIKGYFDGIGRWMDTQSEVILELDSISLSDVFSTGGHSSTPEEFLAKPEVQEALAALDPELRAVYTSELQKGGGGLGPRWLTGDPKDRILHKWISHAQTIHARAVNRRHG